MQTISLTEHPKNITVFEAAHMDEAVLKADDALKNDGIQGVVWFEKPAPMTPEKEVLLKTAYIAAMRTVRNDVSTEAQRLRAVLLENDQREGKTGKLSFSPYEGEQNAAEHLDASRLKTITALSAHFPHTRLTVKYEKRVPFYPHYDRSGTIEPTKIDKTKLFGGRCIRILTTREGEGTLAYDLEGRVLKKGFKWQGFGKVDLPTPWQLAAGSFMFLPGCDWGRDKALLHSSPSHNEDESVAPTQPTRILDVYDCSFS
jgi:hypothetical protein